MLLHHLKMDFPYCMHLATNFCNLPPLLPNGFQPVDKNYQKIEPVYKILNKNGKMKQDETCLKFCNFLLTIFSEI